MFSVFKSVGIYSDILIICYFRMPFDGESSQVSASETLEAATWILYIMLNNVCVCVYIHTHGFFEAVLLTSYAELVVLGARKKW